MGYVNSLVFPRISGLGTFKRNGIFPGEYNLQNLRRKKISINSVSISGCEFIEIKQANAIDEILNTTQLCHMDLLDIFSLSSVRKCAIQNLSLVVLPISMEMTCTLHATYTCQYKNDACQNTGGHCFHLTECLSLSLIIFTFKYCVDCFLSFIFFKTNRNQNATSRHLTFIYGKKLALIVYCVISLLQLVLLKLFVLFFLTVSISWSQFRKCCQVEYPLFLSDRHFEHMVLISLDDFVVEFSGNCTFLLVFYWSRVSAVVFCLLTRSGRLSTARSYLNLNVVGGLFWRGRINIHSMHYI
uniref:Transmembrane protein n=1 Tax=Heterorhabditis bacteriophora TaxID=37862 RepID=A0A1I7WGT5_HETBA